MISLYDLLEASNGQLFGEPGAQLFTNFCLDSHLAEDNHLYVTRKTDQGDTSQHIQAAVERGARGVLCTQPPDFDTEGISVIIVKDTEAAMTSWAKFALRKLNPRVIAVTGSSGKSVTTEAISHILSARHNVLKGVADHQGRLRLPLVLAKLRSEHEIVVIELGASQLAEMTEIAQTLEPEVGVVTTIGYAYTDNFN